MHAHDSEKRSRSKQALPPCALAWQGLAQGRCHAWADCCQQQQRRKLSWLPAMQLHCPNSSCPMSCLAAVRVPQPQRLRSQPLPCEYSKIATAERKGPHPTGLPTRLHGVSRNQLRPRQKIVSQPADISPLIQSRRTHHAMQSCPLIFGTGLIQAMVLFNPMERAS